MEKQDIFIPYADSAPVMLKDGWNIEYHSRHKDLFFNPLNTRFYIHKKQEKWGSANGFEIWEDTKEMNAVNANVLHFLIERPAYIPEKWKMYDEVMHRYIFFFGTIFSFDGRKFVLYMKWTGIHWHWAAEWLDKIFIWNDEVLILEAVL